MIADLIPRSTFETYVVGRENGLAAAAARAVVESPGAVYNPLCITGGPGLGKTHILMAIAHEIERADSRFSVEYFTPDGLSEAYHAAVSAGQGDAFRNRLSETDVLLIDDMHALTHQSDVQTELFRVTGEMHAAGKQIVVVSHCPPTDIDGVDGAFLDRIAEGLVVSVEPPEYETRLEILKRRSDERGSRFEEGVLEVVASYDIIDVRELIGVLNRLVALQALSETPLTPDAARALYEGEVAGPTPVSETEEAFSEEVAGVDQFTDFLSGVNATVKRQVDAWESRLNQVTKLWAERGFCTDRLASLTSDISSKSVDEVLKEFERDVGELETLRGSVSDLDASLAEDPAFYDPDRLVEAREIVQKFALRPPSLPSPSKVWRFQGFVGSWANAAAVEAARAVAAYPGGERNPLIFVGSTGVGKTHLLHATGNAISEELRAEVVCLTAQDLAATLAEAENAGNLDGWRNDLIASNALLIDDLHLVAKNERLQQEICLIFERVRGARRQLVCTLNTEPQNVTGLSESTSALLASGFVSTLAPPDRELRRGLVASMLQERVGVVDSALADYLADRPADSVRAVTGAVARVLEAAEGRGALPTAALARELIEGTVSESPRRTPGVRTSGVMVTPSSSVRSVEKMIWTWPDPSERLIEELS
ncbi:DnaA ATPase domain-containing protein [Gemmatimonadota bacterium]